MKGRRAVLVLLLLLTWMHPVLALVSDEVAADAATIEDMIRDLGDSRFAIRIAAAQKLRQAGYLAVSALQEAARSNDPEVAITARELLPDADELRQMRETFIAEGLSSLQTYWRERHFAKMETEASLYVQVVHDDARFLYLHAMALAALERNDEAQELIKKALTVSPEDEAVHYTVGQMLMGLGQYALAEGEFRRILEIPPEGGVYDLNAHLRLAHIMLQRNAYGLAAQHYEAVLQEYRNGTARGVLVGINLEELEEKVRDLTSRAEEAAAKVPEQPDHTLEVTIRPKLRDACSAAYRDALSESVAQLRLKIQPAGLRISDIGNAFTLRYDPEAQQAGFYVGDSLCAEPVALVFTNDTVTVAVAQLDTVYLYRVSRQGGSAEIRESFIFDYELIIIAPESMREYAAGLKVEDEPYTWKALEQGIHMDWLPEELELTMEGVLSEGEQPPRRYTLRTEVDLFQVDDALTDKDEEQKP